MIALPPDRKTLPDMMQAFSTDQKNGAGAGAESQPIFSQAELEQIAFRRFNPYTSLTAVTLSAALDAYEAGQIMTAARLWQRIAKSDPTINTVKPKREEAVSLRPINTRPKDDSPQAADQAAALKNFYDNLTATHATKRHVVGKSSLLLEQMMESVAFEYAAHHIIWHPDAAATFKLPSGQQVPSLSATFEYVPLEFFEARTGELRFLGINNFYNGTPLAPNDWLVTTGPCLMFAGSIMHYFARLATHDMVNFSEKFGSPGILVHTTAQQNTAEGKAAFALAQSLASNYRGVLYGAPENKAEYLWPQGGVSSEGLPMHILKKDLKQEMISMWMGADLSTMSRGGGKEQPVIGASVQGEDQEKKEKRDCRRMSDTLNHTVDPIVLRWFFGNNVPILAEAFIEYPESEDTSELRSSVVALVDAGAQVPIEPVAKRLNVPLAKEGEKTFEKAVKPAPLSGGDPASKPGPSNRKPATNVAVETTTGRWVTMNGTHVFIKANGEQHESHGTFKPEEIKAGDHVIHQVDPSGFGGHNPVETEGKVVGKIAGKLQLEVANRTEDQWLSGPTRLQKASREGVVVVFRDGKAFHRADLVTNIAPSGDRDLEVFLGPHRDAFLKAFANDLQPLRTAMEAVLSPDDISFNSKVAWLRGQLPSLLKQISKSPESADGLTKLLRDAFTYGYTQKSTAELAATTK